MKQLLLYVFLFSSLNLKGQFFTVSGRLLDKNTLCPLSYVNIQINGTTLGTTTNKTGYFNLKVPFKHTEKLITFSYLGYKSETKSTNQIIKGQDILLQQEDFSIEEIIIMPDSTLLRLLKKAYNKIPGNYPMKPTKQKGFYRETLNTNKNQHLYFAEAVLETYKSSYKFSEDQGQVKILKSLVNEFTGLELFGNTRFYGGIFTNEDDFVKKREDFINPRKFSYYNYSVSLTTYQNRKVYVINFDTKNDSLKGTKKGKFYLDKSSLAYIGYEYEDTKRGLKNYNNKNIGIKAKKYIAKAFYFKHDNEWHMKYSSNYMLFEEKKQNFNIYSEYIATEVLNDSVKPIPFKERIEFGDVFSEKAKKYYSDDYWGEYNILKKDSLLDKQIELLYDTIQSKTLLTKKTSYTKRKKLLRILSKFDASYGINYLSVYADKAMYTVDYVNNISFSEELESFNYNLSLIAQIEFNLNYRWSVNWIIYSSLNKNIQRNTYDIGASYRILLNKQTRPLILKFSLLSSFNLFARNFSTYQNNSNLNFGNRTFNTHKLQFKIGTKSIGVKPQMSLEYNLKGILWITLSGAYYLPLYSDERLFLSEKSGFFLTRKKSSISLSDNSLEVTYNSESTNKSHLGFRYYTLSLGFMINF